MVEKVNTLSGRKQKEVLRILFSAEEMNKYFCSISTVTNYQDPIFLKSPSSELPQLELHHVCNYLKRVKVTAAGHDDLPHWFIRENAHNLAESLPHLYNLCIRYQIFPDVFKLSKVVPVRSRKLSLNAICFNPYLLPRFLLGFLIDSYTINLFPIHTICG